MNQTRSRGKCISQPRACSILYLPHNGRAVKVCDMWMRWRQQPEIELLKCQSRFLLLWNCQALTTSLSRSAAPWAREWGTFSLVKCSWALCATTNRNPIHEYEKCSSIGNRSVALPYGLCWAADIGSLWLPMGKAPAYACMTLFIGISIKDHMSSLTIFSCVKQLSMFWKKNWQLEMGRSILNIETNTSVILYWEDWYFWCQFFFFCNIYI